VTEEPSTPRQDDEESNKSTGDAQNSVPGSSSVEETAEFSSDLESPIEAETIIDSADVRTPSTRKISFKRKPIRIHPTWARYSIALILALIYASTIASALYSAIGNHGWTNTKDLLEVILSTETALLGSALGFYFGTRDRDQS
jgi:hypothetical protein